QILELTPHLENGQAELSFTHRLALPAGQTLPFNAAKFFTGLPPLALIDHTFYLLRNAPPLSLLEYWSDNPAVPVRKLSHRLRTHLRKIPSHGGVDWEQLCVTHKARPEFLFELAEDTVRLRLLARSERNHSVWHWTGQEWQPDPAAGAAAT